MGNLEDAHTAFRCAAVGDGRRCQLYVDHEGRHAAAELAERGPYQRSSRKPYPWRTTCWVWGYDAEPVAVDLDSVRGHVRWCALFAR